MQKKDDYEKCLFFVVAQSKPYFLVTKNQAEQHPYKIEIYIGNGKNVYQVPRSDVGFIYENDTAEIDENGFVKCYKIGESKITCCSFIRKDFITTFLLRAI